MSAWICANRFEVRLSAGTSLGKLSDAIRKMGGDPGRYRGPYTDRVCRVPVTDAGIDMVVDLVQKHGRTTVIPRGKLSDYHNLRKPVWKLMPDLDLRHRIVTALEAHEAAAKAFAATLVEERDREERALEERRRAAYPTAARGVHILAGLDKYTEWSKLSAWDMELLVAITKKLEAE